MKRHIALLVLAVIMVLQSCKKDDPTPPAPKAEFSFGSSSNGTVAFTNLSLNHTSSDWSFGDGETSSLGSPIHLFKENKTYQVSLTVSNGTQKDVIVKSVSVTGVKGTLLVYKKFSTDNTRNIEVSVDGVVVGVINGAYYFNSAPDCGNGYSATATNLSEGTHTVSAKETSGGLFAGSWTTTVNIKGGYCNSLGLTK